MPSTKSQRLAVSLLKSIARDAPSGRITPRILVETGTLRGDTTAVLRRVFRQVHTIELSPVLARRANRRFAGTNVVVYQGDSATILPSLCKLIDEPAVFYLDAHAFDLGGDDGQYVARDNPMPLWDELKAVSSRPYGDLVIVDDLHAFGRPDSVMESVTVGKICQALGESRIVNQRLIRDRFVAWMNP